MFKALNGLLLVQVLRSNLHRFKAIQSELEAIRGLHSLSDSRDTCDSSVRIRGARLDPGGAGPARVRAAGPARAAAGPAAPGRAARARRQAAEPRGPKARVGHVF